jgi:hypothetical protein
MRSIKLSEQMLYSTKPRIRAIALKLKMGAILNRAGWTLKMNPPEAMENPLLPQYSTIYSETGENFSSASSCQ